MRCSSSCFVCYTTIIESVLERRESHRTHPRRLRPSCSQRSNDTSQRIDALRLRIERREIVKHDLNRVLRSNVERAQRVILTQRIEQRIKCRHDEWILVHTPLRALPRFHRNAVA
eukprot:EC684407.1.p1 GENE.EC684407.1~~EC684407.1.p1  ORF type:complete len:115 (-),score=50.92 EC684407.1:85-429(-)